LPRKRKELVRDVPWRRVLQAGGRGSSGALRRQHGGWTGERKASDSPGMGVLLQATVRTQAPTTAMWRTEE
jgi:hypothetical protein